MRLNWRRMRIVFVMVMNHSSIEHARSKESRSSGANPKAAWYIWRDKPNNWKSATGGSGWQYAREGNPYEIYRWILVNAAGDGPALRRASL